MEKNFNSQNVPIQSGSTLLNLALTGKSDQGWKLGRISNLVGDRSSGKTLLAIQAATLFLLNPPEGITPRVIYYEAEAAFDKEYAESLGMPVDQVEFRSGETIEDLFNQLEEVITASKDGTGTLVILDSLDAISSTAELKKDIAKQDYDRKAAKLSEMFRKLVRRLEDSNTHLMIISQVRENISTLPFAPKYRRSGGKALDFYATHIVWLVEMGKLKSSTTNLTYGIEVKADVKKNKVAKPYREAQFAILMGAGIDDTESMLKFLSNEKLPLEIRIRKATGGYYLFDEQKLRTAEMVPYIEERPELYCDLITRTEAAWNFLEEKTSETVQRQSKSSLLTAVKNLKNNPKEEKEPEDAHNS